MKQFFQILFALFFVMNVSAQIQTVSNQKSIGDLVSLGYSNTLKLANGDFLLSCSSNSGVSGDKNMPSYGESDIWIIRVDANYNIIWQKSFGGDNQDINSTSFETEDGDIIVGGSSFSQISGNKTVGTNGENDFWIVKLTHDGNIIWQKNYGGDGFDVLKKIELIDNTRYLLVGNSTSSISGDKTEANRGVGDVWAVMIDSAGTTLWDKTFGGSKNDVTSSLFFNELNDEIIIGCTSDSDISGDKIENSKGTDDIWILKLNLNGELIFQKTIGGDNIDRVEEILFSDDFYYFICTSWSSDSGDKTSPSNGINDIWILKFDNQFDIFWDFSFGGESNDLSVGSIMNSKNQIIVCGSSKSNISETKSENSKGEWDVWIISIDTNGNKIWDKTIGGSLTDLGLNIYEKSNNNFAIFSASESGISGDKTAPNRGMFHFWMFDLTTTLGIDALEQTNFTVYPNPANDWIHVPFVDNKPTVFTLTDASGRIVDSGVLTATQLDVSTFQNGMYTLQLQTDDHVLVSRFVVER